MNFHKNKKLIITVMIFLIFVVLIATKIQTHESYLIEDGSIFDDKNNCWIKLKLYDAVDNNSDIEWVKTWGKRPTDKIKEDLEIVNKIASASLGDAWVIKSVGIQTGYNIDNCYFVYAYTKDKSTGLFIEYDLSRHERKRM
jgi:hypothetical protein